MCWRLGFSFGVLLVSNLRSGTSIGTCPKRGQAQSPCWEMQKQRYPVRFFLLFSFHFVSCPMPPWASIRVPSLRRSPTTHATCLNPPLAAKIVQKKRCLALHNTSKFGLFRSLAPCTTNKSDCSMGALPACPGLLGGFPPAQASALASHLARLWYLVN